MIVIACCESMKKERMNPMINEKIGFAWLPSVGFCYLFKGNAIVWGFRHCPYCGKELAAHLQSNEIKTYG